MDMSEMRLVRHQEHFHHLLIILVLIARRSAIPVRGY